MRAADLIQGRCYFLHGYLDEACQYPFIRSLVYLRMVEDTAPEWDGPAHLFCEAVHWLDVRDESRLEQEQVLIVPEQDLEAISTRDELIQILEAE